MSLRLVLIAIAVASCTRAVVHGPRDGGDDQSQGTGGDQPGLGGAGGDDGSGGSDGLGGSAEGVGGSGSGGSGSGGSGSGGAGGTGPVDAGTGGVDAADPDAGQLGIRPSIAGELIVTEIMPDTTAVADDNGEWFELFNPSTTDTFDLFGCVIFDSSSSNMDVIGHVAVLPQHYVTLARFGDPAVGGFASSFNYHVNIASATDVKFGNSGDRVVLNCSGVAIDVVSFLTWPIASGRSFSLDPTHYNVTDNDALASWCYGVAPAYHVTGTGSDQGTPNGPNPSCGGCLLPACP